MSSDRDSKLPSPSNTTMQSGATTMKCLPLTKEIAEISKRVIWFEQPEQAIAHAMTYGTHKDIAVVRRYLSEDDLRTALTNALPGIFDSRSWAY